MVNDFKPLPVQNSSCFSRVSIEIPTTRVFFALNAGIAASKRCDSIVHPGDPAWLKKYTTAKSFSMFDSSTVAPPPVPGNAKSGAFAPTSNAFAGDAWIIMDAMTEPTKSVRLSTTCKPALACTTTCALLEAFDVVTFRGKAHAAPMERVIID
eukprot:CAMPEP_0179685414 /NCGR_PEP_ID=MMETSP0936-20121108/1092_1 /TAXON_ID=548131 ORGANISM="Ostreococcus mediterraneus, Strain clade-D-RCC2573" /NCGR_SAMPLE_ID=MMETSP0936 /ASSEMBLY_ACC=CAM_ASM_000574 /LENGTH=152 /DNA_ID=CAMNT_0021557837 /DNA_START=159 /DNA_END=617 /DNA_ORIENTATION=+